MLPREIRGVAVTNVDSLAVDANNRLYAGVSTVRKLTSICAAHAEICIQLYGVASNGFPW